MQTSLHPVSDVALSSPVAPAFNQRAVMAWVAACALPAMALFSVGRASLAGYCFWAVLGLALVVLAARGRGDELLCLALAVMPVINLLRDYAFYNVIIVMLVVIFLYWLVVDRATLGRIWGSYPLAWVLVAWTVVYYVFSFLFTGQYSRNLRLLELSLTVLGMLLIGRQRRMLLTMLAGFCLAAVLVSLAFLAQAPAATAGRLGMLVVEDRSLGNPVQLGMPLALSWLVLVVDRGQWSLWGRTKIWRWVLAAIVFVALALTTSRVSWAVAVIGVLVSFLAGSRQRWQILTVGLVVAAGIQLLLLSPYGEGFERGLTRTFSSSRSMANRTSGRSDQWQVSYRAVMESPGAMVYGHGPGLGPEVYARVSAETPDVRYAVGERVALHSLFMQVVVESGLVGLGLVVIWLIVAGVNVVRWTRREKMIFPLVCFVGYGLVVVTVSGNDTTSAMFLGLGLLTSSRRQP
ncbi:MAG: hypothetical protein PCFJNLEI_02221 [Verrucomicrobiae bacterium]|nr:hypothetical protein [Verrucomicrobiae bacterium]